MLSRSASSSSSASSRLRRLLDRCKKGLPAFLKADGFTIGELEELAGGSGQLLRQLVLCILGGGEKLLVRAERADGECGRMCLCRDGSPYVPGICHERCICVEGCRLCFKPA